MKVEESINNESYINEVRMTKLERSVTNLNDKMDKIIDLLSKRD